MRLKKSLFFGCVIVCMFMMFGMLVKAEEKEYDISSVNFDVTLNRDGSADVIEEWTVTYRTGEFSRFYKEIYKDVTKLEEYDNIFFKNFWINNTLCELVYDTDTKNFNPQLKLYKSSFIPQKRYIPEEDDESQMELPF